MAVSARRQNTPHLTWLFFFQSGTLQRSSDQDFLTKCVKSAAPKDTTLEDMGSMVDKSESRLALASP